MEWAVEGSVPWGVAGAEEVLEGTEGPGTPIALVVGTLVLLVRTRIELVSNSIRQP